MGSNHEEECTMTLLEGPLGAVFGATFGALFRDAVLHKTTTRDTGAGGFTATAVDSPVKAIPDALGSADRAASGLPVNAVRFTVLLAGVPVAIDLDDSLTLGGATWRVVKVDADPAGAAATLAAVPA